MNVTVNNIGDVTVTLISGELDGSTAPVAQQQVLAVARETPRIVLDLTEVPYMSSAGLRMLLSTYRQVTNNGGKIVLVGVTDEIKDTMEVTGFLKFFTLTDTVDQAVTALKS
jgi:anti-sigma B factor antagonist